MNIFLDRPAGFS